MLQKIINTRPKSFFNLYGSTEVSPWILSLNVITYFNKFENPENIPPILPAGLALPNVLLKISNSSELLVKANSVFNGYENVSNKDIFIEIKSNKFFRTGDFFVTFDGFFFCRGRINSSVKLLGVFINPILLEIELKDKLSLGNILLVPDIINSKLIVIIFVEVKSVISNSLLKIKRDH